MKLNIARQDMNNAANTVLRGASTRSSLPILAGILIDARENGQVVFQTTDLEVSIRTTVMCDVIEPGKTVVPGKLFADIVKGLPDAAVSLETAEISLQIRCMDIAYTVSCLDASDFPYFPEVEKDASVTLGVEALSQAVGNVVKAVSKDESKAVLTGILFTFEDDVIRLAATDSYRLAQADIPFDGEVLHDFSAVVPGKAFDDVVRLASPQDMVTIGFSENQIVFESGNTTYVSRRIEGTYPNYKQLFPPSCEVRVQLDAKQLITAVKRVALIAQSRSFVRLSFSAELQQVTVSSETQGIGGAQETLDAHVEGEDVEIAFNHQYLLDGLTVLQGDVVIELQSSLRPGIIKGAEDDTFIYLAMPVRLP